MPDTVIKDTMETDIVIVDTEETNTLIRDIMETDILGEETKHKVFNRVRPIWVQPTISPTFWSFKVP